MKQLSMIPKPNLLSGGSLNNTRREKRVLSSKKPIHLVLKSQKSINLFKRKDMIEETIRKQAKNFGIKIYSFSVQVDHIHSNIRIPNRLAYIKFIRAVTGLLARRIKKGLWILRPFTRIGHWGRDFRGVKAYVFQNEMEVHGIWPYRQRKPLPP